MGFVALLLITELAACGGGGDNDANAVATTAPAITTAPADQEWKKVAPGGDCECADGSEFALWERRNGPTKVVSFLDGGAFFDATTCAFTSLGTGGRPAAFRPPGFDRDTFSLKYLHPSEGSAVGSLASAWLCVVPTPGTREFTDGVRAQKKA